MDQPRGFSISMNPLHFLSKFLFSRQSAAPFLRDDFVSLAYHTSIVVGNTLYIDGGEVSYKEGGQFSPLRPMNNTLAIDLTQSWEPSTVSIQTFPKPEGLPVLNEGSLWSGADNESFYAFGGALTLLPPKPTSSPPNSLWQFSKGSWSFVNQNGDSFSKLTRPAGALAASGNGVGYMLGGYDSVNTFTWTKGGFTPVPGIISYDMASNEWSNETALEFRYGTAIRGGMQFVSSFGSAGLLVALGGESPDSSSGWFDSGQGLLPFSQVSIYDPSTNSWYGQTATGYTGPGDIPPGSSMFCTAGVQSDGSTYEM